MEIPAKADPALDDRWLSHVREHPLRARLLALASRKQWSWPELVEALKQPQSLLAYHWRVLAMAGLLDDQQPV